MFDWYKIFLKTDFEALDLVSQNLSVFLDGIGQKEILVTKGNLLGITYEDEFLAVNFEGQNPHQKGNYAVYLDADNYVWLGIEVEE